MKLLIFHFLKLIFNKIFFLHDIYLIYIYSFILILILIILDFCIKKLYINKILYFKNIFNFIKIITNYKIIYILYLIFIIFIILIKNNFYFKLKIIYLHTLSTILGQIIKFFIKFLTKIKKPNINNYTSNKYLINLNTNKILLNKIKYFIYQIKYINNYSFPSGHTIFIHNLISFFIIFYKYTIIKNYIFIFILIITKLIIINRLLTNEHKIIDIIFGILINIIIIKFIYIFI